jgi:5-hydroxyisourate hydrolase
MNTEYNETYRAAERELDPINGRRGLSSPFTSFMKAHGPSSAARASGQGPGVPWASSALYAIDDAGGRRLLKEATTNEEGRTAEPLLSGAELAAGRYEIVFLVGEYFRAKAGRLPGPSFLEDAQVRFAIADAGAHYHVPLLVSPWSYTTYRGS